MTPKTRRLLVYRDIFSISMLMVMIMWFGHDMITEGKVPFFRDLGPYFYPMRFSLAESLGAGELPLWDRHVAGGFPLLADFQSGAFYPPHLAFIVFPFFRAVSVLFLFHYAVAGIGSYLLCRHWGYPSYLSLIGAILFAFGGVIVSLTNLLNHFQAAVWLPWIVLCAERCLYSNCWGNFLLFVLVLLLQFLGGSPEFYVMSILLVSLASLKMNASGPEKVPYKRMFLVLMGGNALVFALAMVQLAPTVELFLNSRRSQPIPYTEAIDWSLNPSNLFNLFFLDKEVDTTILPGMRLFFLNRASFFVSYYLGAVSLFGVCLWALYSSAKERAVTSVLLVITLVFAFGGYTPVYPFILGYFPLLGLVRFPEKFFFLSWAILWFSILRGLFVLLETDKIKEKNVFTTFGSIFLVLLMFYLVVRLNPELISKLIQFRMDSVVFSQPKTAIVASLLVSIERQIALSLAIIVLLFVTKRKLTRVALCQILLVALVYVDLAETHRDYQYLLDPGFVSTGKRVIPAPDGDHARVFYYPAGATLHPSGYSVLSRPSFKEALSLVYGNLLPNSGVFHGFDYFQEIDAFARRPYLIFLNFADRADAEKRFRLLGTLNVSHVVSFRVLQEKGITLLRHFPEYPSWVYKIDSTVPRVYVVNKSTVDENSEQVLQVLASPDFNPLQEVVLNRSAGITPRGKLIATAKIGRYENQLVTVHASLNDSGILVLADSYYPGWNAYVDGKETEILKANHFFRAVPLSAGTHTVEFRYEPRSFAIGRAISILTLLSIVAISIFLYFRKRRQKLTAAAC